MQIAIAAAKKRSFGSIRFLPVNLFAAVMGLSGLSLAWRQAEDSFGVPAVVANVCGIVAVATFLALGIGFLIKCARYPQTIRAEFRHPVSGNFYGTIAVAVLLLSSVIGTSGPRLGQALWVAGTAMALALCFVFVARLFDGNRDPVNKVPATLVPVVGTLDIPVAGGTMPFSWTHEINLLSLAVGGIVAVVFFVMILSRLIHRDPLPAGLTPSMMILIAPFEVGFLGYTNVGHRIDLFASLLYYFGLFLFAVLFFKVFKKSVPFGASWWAVSFPIAALSLAAFKYAAYADSPLLLAVAAILLALLTVIVAVLLIRTLRLLFTGRLLQG